MCSGAVYCVRSPSVYRRHLGTKRLLKSVEHGGDDKGAAVPEMDGVSSRTSSSSGGTTTDSSNGGDTGVVVPGQRPPQRLFSTGLYSAPGSASQLVLV